MLKITLAIAAGGAAGAIARYALGGAVQAAAGASFPLGTLVVNVLGCLLIGGLGAYFAGPHLVSETWRAALLIGLLGSFTTFSTFGWESFELMNDGQFLRAAMNVLLSVMLGLAAVWIGYRLIEHWVGA